MITIDFIVSLPHSPKGYNFIWVIMDRMTKVAHFLSVKTSYGVAKYAQLYLEEILRLHGAPLSIILNRGSQFTSCFWEAFQEALGTRVDLSSTFHPQIDG